MSKIAHFENDSNGVIRFFFGERMAGAYQSMDDHKPFLHPLLTPKGYKVSLSQPHDHFHHKALMFSLQTEKINYWEEYVFTEGVKVGVQIPQGDPELSIEDDCLFCRQTLNWGGDGDTEPQMVEERTISCSFLEEDAAFEWTWRSRLMPRVEVKLTKSPYSPENKDGVKVNYHGLGIRFPREFGCTGGNEVSVDGQVHSIPDALGKKAKTICFTGSIDEVWPVPQCEVSFSSDEPFGAFIMESPFAYLAYGPSILDEPVWNAGEEQLFEFTIRVADKITQK